MTCLTISKVFAEKGYVRDIPSVPTIFRYMQDRNLFPLLYKLVVASALPLKDIEKDFGPDSTGFSSSVYSRWFSQKWGHQVSETKWIKLHMMAGLNTHIVTVAHATEKPTADSPYMPGFLEVTDDNFVVEMVAADKGYLSKANYRAINDLGASGYIPFKSNSTAHSGHHKRDYVWEAAYHLFTSHKTTDFDPNYHQRSNAETVFQMIKAKFGSMVRCRLPDAQVNEVMLKVLCHNLRVLVKVAFEYECTQLLGPKPFDTLALP